jgi:hypothetical protein
VALTRLYVLVFIEHGSDRLSDPDARFTLQAALRARRAVCSCLATTLSSPG